MIGVWANPLQAAPSALDIAPLAALRAPFVASTPVARAELVYTADDSSPWPERPWTALPARLGPNTIDADLPPAARHAFLNLIDERGLVSSSDFIAIVQ